MVLLQNDKPITNKNNKQIENNEHYDPADKKERLYVATRLHIVMLIVAMVVGCIDGIISPASGGSYFAINIGTTSPTRALYCCI